MARAWGVSHLRDDNGQKRCHYCLNWYLPSNFPGNHKNKDGLATVCKDCNILAKFGITYDYFQELLKKQKNRCAICLAKFIKGKRKQTGPYIDHDHNHCDGAYGCKECVRGLLCFNCNSGLGCFMDSALIVSKAVTYLKEWK